MPSGYSLLLIVKKYSIKQKKLLYAYGPMSK
jgi:hypothetical protein